jgi:uncharacterized membrane protein YkvA (DUF1232 family)
MSLREWARTVRRDVHAAYLVARDPRTPWYVKALALCVAGYALSPIDLVPDVIPILGYVDDLLIVPLGILLVVKLTPPEILAECRAAAARATERPTSRLAMGFICAVWIGVALLTGWLVYRGWTE